MEIDRERASERVSEQTGKRAGERASCFGYHLHPPDSRAIATAAGGGDGDGSGASGGPTGCSLVRPLVRLLGWQMSKLFSALNLIRETSEHSFASFYLSIYLSSRSVVFLLFRSPSPSNPLFIGRQAMCVFPSPSPDRSIRPSVCLSE